MKAKVQYNDWKGTAAADIADDFANSIDEYLRYKSPKYNKSQYHCIGCELQPYDIDKLDAVFYCREIKTGKITPMRFSSELDLTELRVMFKRFNVVIGERIDEVDDPDSETEYLD
jgi:hypothetical protein